MKEDNLKSNLKLFEEIFKREALEYYCEYYYGSSEEAFKWSEKKLQEIVESNSKVNSLIKHLINKEFMSPDNLNYFDEIKKISELKKFLKNI